MKPTDLEIAAQTHFAKYGEYALSVFAMEGLDRDGIARVAQLPHPVVRESTVQQIHDAGYEVVPSPSFGEGHADLKLPAPPSEEDWSRLDGVFSEPMPNATRL